MKIVRYTPIKYYFGVLLGLLLLTSVGISGYHLWEIIDDRSKMTLSDFHDIINNYNYSVNRQCAGTMIDPEERIILTAYHCVSDLRREDGTHRKVPIGHTIPEIDYEFETEGTLLEYDFHYDLAIVKLNTESEHGARKITFSEREIEQGEKVFIVGNPFGEIGSASVAYISHIAPRSGLAQYQVQIFGALIPGTSGGSIWNEYGEFMGVPVQTRTFRQPDFTSFTPYGYYVPVRYVEQFLRENCHGAILDDRYLKDDVECLAHSIEVQVEVIEKEMEKSE